MSDDMPFESHGFGYGLPEAEAVIPAPPQEPDPLLRKAALWLITGDALAPDDGKIDTSNWRSDDRIHLSESWKTRLDLNMNEIIQFLEQHRVVPVNSPFSMHRKDVPRPQTRVAFATGAISARKGHFMLPPEEKLLLHKMLKKLGSGLGPMLGEIILLRRYDAALQESEKDLSPTRQDLMAEVQTRLDTYVAPLVEGLNHGEARVEITNLHQIPPIVWQGRSQ